MSVFVVDKETDLYELKDSGSVEALLKSFDNELKAVTLKEKLQLIGDLARDGMHALITLFANFAIDLSLQRIVAMNF